ncbi:hypothetical protein LMH87_000197 [Akanthomyces muscarius]|uniref:Uncharacterized protein n=1 Tax=Akanthomyces muscarius TaxID=2231603 RepID=A0A9W8UNK7_AKAMU|nr:hypothetical protein LMH87_000197 [Akanthomyces muscarius]KAJ4154926.1 hypothetical protein LMH87_000197 [Akanthomyces muscarius]
MIRYDGASTWPPTANHNHDDWSVALRGYKLIYFERASLLPRSTPSLDDGANRMAICKFRELFRDLLRQHLDADAVYDLIKKAENEKGTISREINNVLYSCMAWCRHAYRWGVFPIVKVAQEEELIDLPPELVKPWEHLQEYFGSTSQSGNVMSSPILNFDDGGQHVFKANYGLSEKIVSSEEELARIFRDVEESALLIYQDMIRALVAFDTGRKAACIDHLNRIQIHLRSALSVYYDRLHDQKVARSVWVSHVQGFLGWAAVYQHEQTGEIVKFDGLSGNQMLLFRALDAFLGMDS